MMNIEGPKTKSFWERPEGTTGAIVLSAIGVGTWFALPALLVFMGGLITLLGQTIAVVVLCIILAALLYLITNKKVRTLVSYMFKSVMRKVTGMVVEIDPIGIMKSYISELKEKREGMQASKDKLAGQIKVLEGQINKNNKEHDNAMSLAKVANDRGNTSVFQVNSRQAGRLKKLNAESFEPLLRQMTVHMRALNKYYEVTGTVIDDLNNEVNARKMEREMIMASYSALSAAKKILQGGTDQKELFDQAMEFVVEDFGMKMGEIDSFIENSKGFVEGLDLQNGVYEEDALKRLQEWENKADSILLGTGKAQLLEHQTTQSTVYQGIGAPAAAQFDYSAIINKK
jgi:ABC-type multidrug transport system fused ATPase/permease subunit